MMVALALFIGLFVYFVLVAVEQTHARMEERASGAAQVVATNAYWIAEVADQTLRRVDAALGPTLTGSETDIAPMLGGLPDAAETYVIDASANTVFSTVPNATQVSVADREYFTALREGADSYVSGLLASRLTGDHLFVFSRRVERNGEFAGAIMISFSGSLLVELADTLDLPEGSTISLVRTDGQLMARSPPTSGPVDLSTHPLFTTYLPASPVGTYPSESSPVDGVPRLVSYRRIDGTPIVALAAVASDPGWLSLRNAVLTVLLIVSPVLIGLFIGCWWIVRLLRHGAERNRQLQESVDLNTMLLREIHHRVKNNLASIQTLVRMQDIPAEAKRDLDSRFAAMAAMHEHIYKHDRFEDINAAEFIPAVTNKVLEAYGSAAIAQYDIEEIAVDRDHATPLALLLSELATNSCKYAFADGRKGEIAVSLHLTPEGKARLVFRDNGVGMADSAPSNSMGMRILRGAINQMGGSYDFSSDNGVVFTAELDLSANNRATAPGMGTEPLAAQ